VSVKPIRQQFADTMLSVGQEDHQLIVMVGDISHFRLQPFAKACPGRFYNIGICEPTMVSMAAGLSKVGMFPVAHTIAPFLLERSFEQIKLGFCYQKLGGTLITVGSAFDYSNLGCTHHCYNDAALFKFLEGTQVLFPGSAIEFDVLFRQTYRNEFLTLLRIPEYGHRQEIKTQQIRLGKGIKIRDGKDVTLIITAPHLDHAIHAAQALSTNGWECEIIYLPTLWPLDEDLIYKSVQKTRRVLVVEEHVRTGGLGSDVVYLTRDIPDVHSAFLCIPDQFIREYGSYQEHCERLGFSPDGIARKVQASFKKY